MSQSKESFKPRTSEASSEDEGHNANFVNRTLFQGENLDYLRLLNSESVDLIATDPPFNKGEDFHSKPDSLADGGSFIDRWKWDDSIQQAWLDELKTVNRDKDISLLKTIECVRSAHSDAMGAYLCYMAVRLLAMRRVLKKTGSIYLHCDHTASHYLKMIMDAIFGKENFINEIVWERIKGAGKRSQHDIRSLGNNTDSILHYGKTKNYFFNAEAIALPYDDIEASFPHKDNKGRYKRRSPFRPPGLGPRPNLCYTYKGVTNPHVSGWTTRKENFAKLDEEGEVDWVNGKPYRKQRPRAGIIPSSLWIDINQVMGDEDTGYATQKPVALYKRIIEAASKKGGMILDPFCGCATTLIAAETTGRQWIGIDLWEEVYDTVEKRLVNLDEAELEGSDGLIKKKGLQEDLLMFDLGKITKITDPSQIKNPYIGKESAPYQKSIVKHTYKKAAWEKLSDKQMVNELKKEQTNKKTGLIVCAGCGREMEVEFMELDHIHPKSDNEIHNISNRILICKPCNGRKSNKWAFKGLWGENKKEGINWMHDEDKAKWAKEQQKVCYQRVRAESQ